MVTKQQEYQARFFQIIGISFMTPVCNLFLKFPAVGIKDLNIKMLIYVFVCFVFVILGIIFNIKGLEYLEEREQKWTQ